MELRGTTTDAATTSLLQALVQCIVTGDQEEGLRIVIFDYQEAFASVPEKDIVFRR